jgi:hypothetical protein
MAASRPARAHACVAGRLAPREAGHGFRSSSPRTRSARSYGGSASCLAAVCPPPRPSAASCRLGPPPAPSLRSWRGAAHGGGGPAGSRPIASKTASAGGFRSIPRPSPCAGPRVLIARFPVCNAVPAPVRATGPLVAPMSRPAGRCAGPAARSIVTPSGGLRCHGGPAAAWMRAVVVGMGDPPRCA